MSSAQLDVLNGYRPVSVENWKNQQVHMKIYGFITS
jgi:hypothetical protein